MRHPRHGKPVVTPPLVVSDTTLDPEIMKKRAETIEWASGKKYEPAHDRHQLWPPACNEGDVAFLLDADNFSEHDHAELMKPKTASKHAYLPVKATAHPVIILKRISPQSQYVLITPISAYSSSKENNYRPPWKQECHKWKAPWDFRSFFPCARYEEKDFLGNTRAHEYLYLDGGRRMPKPEASWLHIQSVYVVPLTVIGNFTKSREVLRVDPTSLAMLRRDMAQGCNTWKESLSRLVEMDKKAGVPVPPDTLVGIVNIAYKEAKSWRRDSGAGVQSDSSDDGSSRAASPVEHKPPTGAVQVVGPPASPPARTPANPNSYAARARRGASTSSSSTTSPRATFAAPAQPAASTQPAAAGATTHRPNNSRPSTPRPNTPARSNPGWPNTPRRPNNQGRPPRWEQPAPTYQQGVSLEAYLTSPRPQRCSPKKGGRAAQQASAAKGKKREKEEDKGHFELVKKPGTYTIPHRRGQGAGQSSGRK
ncbi:hypothetical protein B0T25DRAFT_542551 [Lasiosphaeria hispida]|uniref:Uncharacterized protein n=1 Tax=Lasiosphaeria hispida TaxID=260671 RepID=A0AAJ0MDP8_9PEZI|nr:hypothetical protein B0T25DRAFT_542551 [Lasiosphaeria hispida]